MTGVKETKLWYLENFNLFEGLPKKDLKDLSNRTHMNNYEEGDYIYFPPDSSSYLFFLKQGRVKVGTYSEDGDEIIKAILEPGEIFGGLDLEQNKKAYNEFAQGMEDDVVICSIRNKDLQRIMKNNPSLSLRITKFIGLRLKQVERKLESVLFKDARTRIIELLEEMAEQRGEKVGVEIKVDNILTHKEMAKLCGTSRQTVTTILNELKKDNIIYFDNRQILIRDLEQLAEAK